MRRSKRETPVTVAPPDTTAITNSYNESLKKVQEENAKALAVITKSNEESKKLLEKQLADSNKTNAEYQKKLNEYLASVTKAQEEQKLLAAQKYQKDLEAQDMEKNIALGNRQENNLSTANAIANFRFGRNTARTGFFE